jgi:hypothetical protein
MLITLIVIIIVALIAVLLWQRRGGNSGERDVDVHGVHNVGEDGAAHPNTPRGGNAAGR